MKKRLMTAVTTGAIGVAVGVGVSIWQGLQSEMLGIAIAVGVVGFLFGLFFKHKGI